VCFDSENFLGINGLYSVLQIAALAVGRTAKKFVSTLTLLTKVRINAETLAVQRTWLETVLSATTSARLPIRQIRPSFGTAASATRSLRKKCQHGTVNPLS
jgi:hypothetical protein